MTSSSHLRALERWRLQWLGSARCRSQGHGHQRINSCAEIPRLSLNARHEWEWGPRRMSCLLPYTWVLAMEWLRRCIQLLLPTYRRHGQFCVDFCGFTQGPSAFWMFNLNDVTLFSRWFTLVISTVYKSAQVRISISELLWFTLQFPRESRKVPDQKSTCSWQDAIVLVLSSSIDILRVHAQITSLNSLWHQKWMLLFQAKQISVSPVWDHSFKMPSCISLLEDPVTAFYPKDLAWPCWDLALWEKPDPKRGLPRCNTWVYLVTVGTWWEDKPPMLKLACGQSLDNVRKHNM